MSEKQAILQLPIKGGSGSAKTQIVQFRDDWPGLFVRGDHAIKLAMCIRRLERGIKATIHSDDASSLQFLVELAALIESDVDVKTRT